MVALECTAFPGYILLKVEKNTILSSFSLIFMVFRWMEILGECLQTQHSIAMQFSNNAFSYWLLHSACFNKELEVNPPIQFQCQHMDT